MIFTGNKKVASVYHQNKKIKRIYNSGKIVFDTSARVLPDEYQKIEYVKFTGNQYTYLDYYPTHETKLEIKILATQTRGAWASNSGSGLSNNFTAYLGSSNNNCRFGNKTVSTSMTLNDEHIIEQSKDGFYIDGVRKGTYTGYNSFKSTLSFRIGYNTVYFLGNVYYLKLWENEVLVRDCVPCYRKEDEIAGFYDFVSGQFFTSDTNTELVAGPEEA